MSGTTASGRGRTAGVPGHTGGGVNRWTVLTVLCVSLLFVALDTTILYVAVPSVTEDLRPGPVELLWIVDIYPLIAASLLILFGTLGDRVGRRRVLLLGYGLFALASAAAALAPNPQILMAARALLGIGGAMIMPATLSILRQVFPDRRERAVAIGMWSAVAAVGAAVGPVLGGFLVENFWWGSVFLINIPMMAAMFLIGRWLLPESRGERNGPWDLLGAVIAAFGVLGIVFGVKRLGSGAPVVGVTTLLPIAVGTVLLVLFVRRQRRRAHPLIDMRLFARPAFGTSIGCIVLAMLALVGLQLIAVQYLQLVLGLSPLETGLRMLPLVFAAMAAGLTGSKVLQALGPRVMVSAGFTLTAIAVLSLTAMGTHDRFWQLSLGFVLLGFGFQSTLFGAYESMLSEAPAAQSGGAAALGETAYQLGAGIGVALLGSVMNAAYAPGLSRVDGVSAGASRSASHSLGEAYKVAAGLGEHARQALRLAARDAFVHGLRVTLVASGVLLLVGAAIALRLPRRAAESGERAEAGAPAEEGAGGAAAANVPAAGREGAPAPARTGR
ncbi:transporter [Streptomyces sp. NRRL F-4489]|uniref:MFS transporter n=1 Tax=Streptomyces sp. NRRL F-4489 TaxID=1609095 RepID=UPI0007463440|nr:MFS transporter [Streptomyces sp. NRRL F-4489]KUL33865.1 transporter [Streptomyces sp. NRRL F-4489]